MTHSAITSQQYAYPHEIKRFIQLKRTVGCWSSPRKSCRASGVLTLYESRVYKPVTLSGMIHGPEKDGVSTGLNPTMDAGIVTEENITWLDEHHPPCLVVRGILYRE